MAVTKAFLYPEAHPRRVSFVLFFFGVWSLCSRQSQVVTLPPANFQHKINHLKIGQTWHEIGKVCAWEIRNQIIVTKIDFHFPFLRFVRDGVHLHQLICILQLDPTL